MGWDANTDEILLITVFFPDDQHQFIFEWWLIERIRMSKWMSSAQVAECWVIHATPSAIGHWLF